LLLPFPLFVFAISLSAAKNPEKLSAATALRPFQPQTRTVLDQTVFRATKSGLSPTHLFRHFRRCAHGCQSKRRNKLACSFKIRRFWSKFNFTPQNFVAVSR
jgi:hypothetical protein